MDEPVGEAGERDRPDPDDQPPLLAFLLPYQDAEDEAAHADDEEDARTDQVDLTSSGVRDVL